MLLSLLLLGFFSFQSGSSSAAHETLQQRRFDVADHKCELIVKGYRLQSGEPSESLTISCDGNQVYQQEFRDTDVGNVTVDGWQPTLICLTWERGTGSGITVVSLENVNGKVMSAKLLDYFAKCGGKFFDSGRIVFENAGRRNFAKFIVPEATNVYHLVGAVYIFQGSYRWNERAGPWEDLCILAHSELCAAKRSETPISDPESSNSILRMTDLPMGMRHGPPVY
jgi:hypothetical protein